MLVKTMYFLQIKYVFNTKYEKNQVSICTKANAKLICFNDEMWNFSNRINFPDQPPAS